MEVWGIVLVVCVCVGVGGVVLCRCVCVCDLLIFLHDQDGSAGGREGEEGAEEEEGPALNNHSLAYPFHHHTSRTAVRGAGRERRGRRRRRVQRLTGCCSLSLCVCVTC